jgi:hypothetical protein
LAVAEPVAVAKSLALPAPVVESLAEPVAVAQADFLKTQRASASQPPSTTAIGSGNAIAHESAIANTTAIACEFRHRHCHRQGLPLPPEPARTRVLG